MALMGWQRKRTASGGTSSATVTHISRQERPAQDIALPVEAFGKVKNERSMTNDKPDAIMALLVDDTQR